MLPLVTNSFNSLTFIMYYRYTQHRHKGAKIVMYNIICSHVKHHKETLVNDHNHTFCITKHDHNNTKVK